MRKWFESVEWKHGFTEWWSDFIHTFRQFWLSADQFFLNSLPSLLFPSKEAWADETLSSRCGRLSHRNPYKFAVKLIDALFYPIQGPNHCRNAYEKEKARYNSPPEMRN